MPKFTVRMDDTALITIRAYVDVEADSFREAVDKLRNGEVLDEDGEEIEPDWQEYDGAYEYAGDIHYTDATDTDSTR